MTEWEGTHMCTHTEAKPTYDYLCWVGTKRTQTLYFANISYFFSASFFSTVEAKESNCIVWVWSLSCQPLGKSLAIGTLLCCPLWDSVSSAWHGKGRAGIAQAVGACRKRQRMLITVRQTCCHQNLERLSSFSSPDIELVQRKSLHSNTSLAPWSCPWKNISSLAERLVHLRGKFI